MKPYGIILSYMAPHMFLSGDLNENGDNDEFRKSHQITGSDCLMLLIDQIIASSANRIIFKFIPLQ